MMNIDMKYIQVVVGLLLCYCLYACSPRPESVQPADRLLMLYPEYQDVTIPYNVAPLNFLVRNEGVDAVCVSVKGASDSLEINARGNKAIFPLKAWRALLEAEKEHTLEVTVTARTDGRWLRYPSFAWQVVADKLDAYVSYRLIEPGYEVWNTLQIRERCIENFEERILADNSQTDGKCMNCHVHGGNSGNLSMFHLRGEFYGFMPIYPIERNSLNKAYYGKAFSKFEQENERRPSPEELADELEIPVDKISDTLKVSGRHISVDAPFVEGEDNSLLDVLVNDDSPMADRSLVNESLSREIDRALSTLTEREKDIIQMFFGINTQEMTLEEIGDKFGLTRERVRQIKEKAIRRLRQNSRSKLLKSYLG